MGQYSCKVDMPREGLCGLDAKASIECGCIDLFVDKRRLSVPFCDLMDMRLLNYRLHLTLRDSEMSITHLGFQTEEFFDKLWAAYAAKSVESLFVEGGPLISCEGDYSYREPEREAKSIARIELHEDCLCILPHDVGARRVPLCFAMPPVREGFSLRIDSDTGESYSLARLGANTEPLFGRLVGLRERAASDWACALGRLDEGLDARLGQAQAQYRAFESLGADVVRGLFSADDEAFWFAAAACDRAAVELVCDESTATYLYRFSCGKDRFVSRLRHAMEAIKRHRRLIYISDEELAKEPLFVMAQDRSSHVRFLRGCNAGRIIHSAGWEGKLRAFFE